MAQRATHTHICPLTTHQSVCRIRLSVSHAFGARSCANSPEALKKCRKKSKRFYLSTRRAPFHCSCYCSVCECVCVLVCVSQQLCHNSESYPSSTASQSICGLCLSLNSYSYTYIDFPFCWRILILIYISKKFVAQFYYGGR